jgi:hypothetical protein
MLGHGKDMVEVFTSDDIGRIDLATVRLCAELGVGHGEIDPDNTTSVR